MDKETIAVTGRVIERLIVCLTASGAFILGWNLFRVGVVDLQSGELKGTGWSVKLQKCGPGIFFSLFGTVVLVASFMSPLKINSTEGPKDITQSGPTNSNISLFGEDAGGFVKFTGSLNTLLAIAKNPDVRSQLHPQERLERLDRAIHYVELYKDEAVRSRFGSDALLWYKTNAMVFESNPTALPPQEREKYQAIRTILDDPLTN